MVKIQRQHRLTAGPTSLLRQPKKSLPGRIVFVIVATVAVLFIFFSASSWSDLETSQEGALLRRTWERIAAASHDNNDSSSNNATVRSAQRASAATSTIGIDAYLTERPSRPVVIAYAISLIQCSNRESSTAGLLDAALVLRHSIHLTSVRGKPHTRGTGGNITHVTPSQYYDYKMYALVHPQAVECSDVLRQAGFHIVVVEKPPIVDPHKDITGSAFLQKNVHKEWCCGHQEFIKLHAYKLPEPVAVHLDVDFCFQQPMDDVLDVLLYDAQSSVARAARARLEREFPDQPWPLQPRAMMTRDWPQVVPGRKAGYQAGFLVTRTNASIVEEITQVIKTTKYVEGYQPANGWGGLGYGGYVGAMAMQGLLAYYYDQVAVPGSWVELNQCRYNHMGMDVRYRAHPNFRSNHPQRGKCRNTREMCEDCMTTPLDKIYSLHYTYCRKPWNCIGEGDRSLPVEKRRPPLRKKYILEDAVHLEHCLTVMTVWHQHRQDLENEILQLTKDAAITNGTLGQYKRHVFQGHCAEHTKYLPLSFANTNTIQRIPELYQ